MGNHCPGCGNTCEEDDDRLCSVCCKKYNFKLGDVVLLKSWPSPVMVVSELTQKEIRCVWMNKYGDGSFVKYEAVFAPETIMHYKEPPIHSDSSSGPGRL